MICFLILDQDTLNAHSKEAGDLRAQLQDKENLGKNTQVCYYSPNPPPHAPPHMSSPIKWHPLH